ncbi:GTP pyrophosphokinase [Mediterraneibacter massiliensis]|uniref:GTP pyrophosphokinase n=1 Tax=Mediterraneibacter massiliensis TaxID=1720300 RepID=UPI000821DD8D|nr:GTP pyrophosphokinase [Mediterraneibacter massiliensis]SCI04907.1 GTP pyrophosphokinase ywaC [uncultured Clostridium sp.]
MNQETVERSESLEQNKEQLREFLTEGIFPVKGQCVIQLLLTKLEMIDMELSMVLGRNVIQAKSGRMKSYRSTCKKLEKKGLKQNIPTAVKKIHDLIGVRAVCYYVDDIYRIEKKLKEQSDIRITKVKDYIQKPKSSGYQSLHVILQVPIGGQKEVQWMDAELQLRTVEMDFWASLDHQLRYKKEGENMQTMDAELKECARMIQKLDAKMLHIRKKIEQI